MRIAAAGNSSDKIMMPINSPMVLAPVLRRERGARGCGALFTIPVIVDRLFPSAFAQSAHCFRPTIANPEKWQFTLCAMDFVTCD